MSIFRRNPNEAQHPDPARIPRAPLPGVIRSEDGDVVTVTAGKAQGIPVIRLHAMNERHEAVTVILTADHAREVAAAALAAADLADGTQPLTWPETAARPARRAFACDESPQDTLSLRTVAEAGNRPAAVVLAFHGGDHALDVAAEVPAPAARRFGAAVLNGADYAEGLEVPDAL